MKKLIIIIMIVLMHSVCLADELQLPFSCYPAKVQTQFANHGYKLDLSANDRDETSWGFLVSQGSKFSIFTYKSVTQKEFEDILKIIGEAK